jgi:hypothetical protein
MNLPDERYKKVARVVRFNGRKSTSSARNLNNSCRNASLREEFQNTPALSEL